MITLKTRTYLHCKCDRPECGHEWDSFRVDAKGNPIKPRRCAGCKYRLVWNSEDHRRRDPYKGALSYANGTVPQLRPKDLLETFIATKAILEQLIADYGPCDHPKACVCEETGVLGKVNKQIDTLVRLTEKKKKRSEVTVTA